MWKFVPTGKTSFALAHDHGIACVLAYRCRCVLCGELAPNHFILQAKFAGVDQYRVKENYITLTQIKSVGAKKLFSSPLAKLKNESLCKKTKTIYYWIEIKNVYEIAELAKLLHKYLS